MAKAGASGESKQQDGLYVCSARLAEMQSCASPTGLSALAGLDLRRLLRRVLYRTWCSFCLMCSQTTATGGEQEEAETTPVPVLASVACLLRIPHTRKTLLSCASC